ncbi:MAG TPA: 2-oxo acid dehydrogenase subunit E2, partial [Gemmatimonadaceae bacterium]
MATKVFMEALSPTMEEGRLVKWTKNEGDAVKTGDPIAEVETDKAIMELVARADGVLRKRIVPEGESRPVGSIVGIIAGADENIDAIIAEAGGQMAAGASAGTPPAQAPAAELTQAAAPAPQPPASAPTPVGGSREPSAESREPGAAVAGPQSGRVRSSPLARRLAAEKGVDLGALQGSGPGGRIVKKDIESAQASGQRPAASSAGAAARPASGADFEDQSLTQIRKTIAKRLSESIGPIPTFYLTAEIDMERVAEARSAMAEMGDEFKASFNDVILKAVATALRQHPEVNAHWLGDRIRYHHRV